MRNKLTDNIGLKILSVISAMFLWLIVVNVDDPVISRTYTGIPVEITNKEAILEEGKTYEILDSSDTISVVISAKRSIIEQLSKDYIKATADMKDISFLDTVHIEVRTTRYSDLIESITSRTKNLKVKIENLEEKEFPINIETSGEPKKGYILGSIESSEKTLRVSGPASVVQSIAKVAAVIDITDIDEDKETDADVIMYDEVGEAVETSLLNFSTASVHINARILETKEVPIVFAVSGIPAEGYAATGSVSSTPSSVIVAGSGRNYENLSVLSIPAECISITGATKDVTESVQIEEYLPDGIMLADKSFDGNVEVTAIIGRKVTKEVDIPTANITIENVPIGFHAVLVDIGGMKRVRLEGLIDRLNAVNPTEITGSIDALTMSARSTNEGEEEQTDVHQGAYDGILTLNLPDGVTMEEPVYMQVILNPLADLAQPKDDKETQEQSEEE